MYIDEGLNVSQEFLDPRKIRRNIPEFVKSLKNYLTREGTTDQLTAQVVPSYRKVRKTVEKIDYSNLRETKIYIPAGLSVTFLEYQEALDQSVGICEKVLPEVLTPFSRWLAQGLSDPEKLRSVRGASGIDKFNPHNIDGALSDLGRCFKRGENRIKGKFGDYFARNKDVKVVFEQHDDQIGRMVKTDRKAIFAKVEEISDNLDTLIQRIDEDPDDYDFSQVNLDLLSKLSYTLAQEVQFYGTVHYQLTALNTALVDTQKVLK